MMNDDKTGYESYTIRHVASREELKATLGILGAQFRPPVAADAPEFAELLDHYPQDRRLMLVVERDGQIVGGALGFGNTLRVIAVKPEARGIGLGRRLLQTYEVGAMRQGVSMISLGAVDTAKGFYERMGYRGKASMHKELPLPGRVFDLRLRKLEARLGDLDAGQPVRADETGKIPPLF